jgi:hypothetical protein
MANLTSQANRLNDIEINNNKPVTGQVFRRIGSNVNYLLDYLGITNGASLAGPSTGLNVFSPVQNFSYNYTFNAGDIGVDRQIFTFTGGGDRPLCFFNRTGDGFSTGKIKANPIQIVSGFAQVNDHAVPSTQYPIFDLAYRMAQIFGGTQIVSGSVTSPYIIIKVNGTEAARIASAGTITIQQFREITHAPSGTNSVTVRILGSYTANISGSYEYVAL